MRDNALRQIQSFAEQQEFDVINNETRHDVTSLIATWWKPLLAKVKREVEVPAENVYLKFPTNNCCIYENEILVP